MSQKRYAYLIGANGPQTDRLAMLKYAEKDAQRLAEALRTSHCAFTDAEATIAENPQPTLAGLGRFVKQCEPSDLLLVHFSGHADRGRGGQLILLCNGTDIDDYTSSAIKISSIKEYLDECKARQKVLILDCCHASAAHTSPFKGDQDLRSSLQQTLEGSVNIILSACSYRDRTRELAILDDGAGFLSWALTTACTSRFQELSPDDHSLSLMDIWQWIPTALRGVNDRLGPKEQLPQPILLSEMKAGDDSEIWLTEQRRAHTSKFVPDQLTRKKYLESVYKRYSSVTLPLGPAEGFSLHAVFQPLELRRDPLAAEDLDRKKRRPFLGERLEDEKDADHFRLERDEKERADEKQRPIIAENGEDALTKSPQRRVVVLGGPGTGKTTTLKHFVGCRAKEALTNPNDPIPIFLSLADLARSQKTLQSYLVDLVEELGIERTYAETLWKAIEAGQAFVCLDSLDEVEPQRRQKMIEWVNAWAAESGNTWVVGSRFTEYKNGSFKYGRFAEWELLPMDHQLRLELAERLLPELQQLLQNALEKSLSPATFVKLLEDHPQAAAWGENPLLFSLAAVVFLRMEKLPSSRAMLYREVIDAILKTREASPVWCTVLLRLLAQFALWLHQTKGRVFTINDLVSFLADLQGKSLEETADLAERILRSGMMEPVARQTYGFRHQTFQEYLAAVELAQRLTHRDRAVREEAWKLAWSKRTYSRWIEVLRLMVGVLSQQPGNKGKLEAQHWLGELIEQRSTEEGDPGDLGLALALKSLAEITEGGEREAITTAQLEKDIIFVWLGELLQAARVQRKTKQKRLQSLARDVFHLHGPEVDEVLNHLLKSLWNPNRNVRDAACKMLQELGKCIPTKPLIAAISDLDSGVRLAAIEILDAQRECVPLELLLAALRDPYEYVRSAAVRALGRQGRCVPIEPLLEALYDEYNNVCQAAVEALKVQGERVPIEPLLEALHDEYWEVCEAAAQVLGAQGERVPIELLLEALHDRDSNVRWAAAEVLGAQGKRVPIEPLLDALHDGDDNVRSAAVKALGAQGERVPIEPLLDALHDGDDNVRSAAVKALGAQGERVPIEPLLDALHDGDEGVRRAAVKALGEQGERVSIEPLLDALHDEYEDVRQTTIQALKNKKNHIPVETLLSTLHDQYNNIRLAAIEVLGAQEKEIPIKLLFDALNDQNRKVRQAAVKALGAQGERVPIEPLLDALRDEYWRVRQAVVKVLGEQEERVPIEPLLEALYDQHGNVRQAVVEVLGKQGERVPIEPLLEALHNEDGNVRQAVVEVLGGQRKRVPIEPLLEALHDEDRYVRQAAVEALGGQGEHVPIEPLLEVLYDDDWNVCQAAAQVLGEQGERVPIEPLLEALRDRNKKIRQAAIKALGEQGERVPIEFLLEALHDEDGDLRRVAVEALRGQGERVPLEVLLEALHDEYWAVRQAVVEILGGQEKRVPIEALLEALHDGDDNVRCAVVEALGAQGGRLSVEPLLEALHDEDRYVRRAAIGVLGAQGEHVPLELLLDASRDKDESVRQAAVEVLGEQGERVPLEPLLDALHDEYWSVRCAAIQALEKQGECIPLEHFLEALGDDHNSVGHEAVKILSNRAPHILVDVTNEALAILNGQPFGQILGSIAQTTFCKLVAEMKLAPPAILDELTELLNWPHWQVRINAAKALASIRRNIPNEAIRRLLELRRIDPVRVVREAADDALAEILSLETGIEDD